MPETVPPTRLLQADPSEAGLRLDVILGGHLAGGRSQAQRLVRKGLVSVGTTVVRRPSQTVRAGDLIELQEEPAVVAAKSNPQDARLVYQDELVVVVDKPAGMVVHPGPGHRDGTLAQLVQTWGGEWSQDGGPERAGIVHRLDRGTSGLLVLARTEEAHRDLARQLRTRTMGREYWALAQGGFQEDRGRIEAAVGRDPQRPRRMSVGA
ncbi:MAG: RluA family pseudouridine synthase, partial [Candidatus Dormiibacterota bacterium]